MAAFYAERARGGVGLIVTGGIAPNEAGRPAPGGNADVRGGPRAAPVDHRCRARRGRQDRDADPPLRPLVSELLGHSGIQITADTYTTLFAEVDAAAAEAVAAMVPRS